LMRTIPARLWWVALVVAVAAVALGGCGGREAEVGEPPAKPPEEQEPTSVPPQEPIIFCPLDGQQATSDAVSRRPLVVVIDNHPRARPQSGLEHACIVYEMPVEGGFTRLLAVYLHAQAPLVGPVRSARHYFIDWTLEHRGILCHVSGSPQAKEQIAAMKVDDLDDFRGNQGFWRLESRSAPHNLYCSTASLRDAARRQGYDRPGLWPSCGFSFSRDREPVGDQAATVHITHSPSYSVTYRYDADAGRYLRFVNDQPHRTDTGQQLAVANVVCLWVPVSPIPGDPEGRLDVDLTGQGRALVFNRGIRREARWVRLRREGPTALLDAKGEPVFLSPGPVWVHVLPRTADVKSGGGS